MEAAQVPRYVDVQTSREFTHKFSREFPNNPSDYILEQGQTEAFFVSGNLSFFYHFRMDSNNNLELQKIAGSTVRTPDRFFFEMGDRPEKKWINWGKFDEYEVKEGIFYSQGGQAGKVSTQASNPVVHK